MIRWTDSIHTVLSSKYHDKKHPHNVTRVNQGCGWCVVTDLSASNIALMHTVVSVLRYLKILIHCFSSFIFNLILGTGPIPDNNFVSILGYT